MPHALTFDRMLQIGRPRLHRWFLLLLAASLTGCPGSERDPAPAVVPAPSDPALQPPAQPRATAQPSANPTRNETAVTPLPGCETLATSAILADEIRKEDPLVEGWQSEAFHDQTNAQLKKLAALLSQGQFRPADYLPLATADFACPPLRPVSLRIAMADDAVIVRRATEESTDAARPAAAAQETSLAAAMQALVAPLADATARRCAFKETHVDLSGPDPRTTVLFQLSGRLPAGAVQVNSTWQLVWNHASPPQLKSITAERYEEISPGPRGHLDFVDVAGGVLGGNESYGRQLAYGFDYWRARSDRLLGSDLAGNQGLSLGDINGDDLDDLYIVQSGGLPNRLFVHQADGTARDVSATSGTDYLDFSRASLFIDLDNDGDQDLVLGLNSGWLALENDGRGQFTRRAACLCPATVYSLAAADYDQDGDLDVYACGRYPQGALRDETRVQGLPIPYHDANNGGPNSLWRNDGSWQFANVTVEAGLDVNNRRFTLAAAWEDYDNDGDQDLYVANDFGRNNLYRNDGGKFQDVAREEGVEDIGAGMSVSWGDCNQDGRMDLYVGNMFSSAGHRVAFQQQFMADLDPGQRAEFQRHARGNSLFLNRGVRAEADFEDVSLAAGVNMGRWAWGSMFADLNGDGREDLFVANGFITTTDPGDL